MEQGQQDQGPQGLGVESARSYHVTLRGGGLALDRELNEQQAWDVLAAVFGQQNDPQVINEPRQQHEFLGEPAQNQGSSRGEQRKSSNEPDAKLSVGEFVEQCQAKRNPDKITAIGVYLQDYAGLPKFTRDDVKQQFQKAGEGIPGNFPRDFNVAISSKWLSEDVEGSGYYVTRTGKTAVEQKFPAEARKTFSSASSRKRKPVKKPADDE